MSMYTKCQVKSTKLTIVVVGSYIDLIDEVTAIVALALCGGQCSVEKHL